MSLNKYIIDGNNLIGKIPELWRLQKKNKQAAREGLAFRLERFFFDKKVNVSLHFDGFPNEAIKVRGIKIHYSENAIADNKIKDEIANAANPRLITVVTSDLNLLEFARVNGSSKIKSEEFAREMNRKEEPDEEEKLVKTIDNEEMKKLFGIE